MGTTLQIQNDSQTHKASTNTNFKQQKPVILIVEDNDDKRSILKTLLDLYDVVILEARTGEEAIDLIVGERPDLVLINTELPGLDGYETTRLIRAIKSLNEMPVIFLSTETERIYRKKAFDVGGNCFYVTPLDLERLDQMLDNHLFNVGSRL